MKYFIVSNSQSKHGYDFVIENDNGERQTIELTRKTTDGYIHIPAEYHETLNRKLVKFTDFENVDCYEVTRRESVNRNVVSSKVSSKSLEDYLSPEDKEVYLSLVKKAMKNKEIEMLKSQIDALQSKLTSMENN